MTTATRLKYEKPIVVKVNKMTFPGEILAKASGQIVCKQCSSCHACR